ncbi:hypothetical protein KL86PLE_60444 [uncultured Pleomorphomonas sp.]|uniref:Uncharacterized protein n=1 Tax=uncultured Pleomorphomonas sp. TaxID=442121 RepID=A0A212LKQ4_9HYPH|nr:hypothetical protein KL86PLE_60444 [uncultured Pleomorphomonas sp.]
MVGRCGARYELPDQDGIENVLTPLAKPESFLFSWMDGDHAVVVRIVEASHQRAVARFRTMSTTERRRATVSRLEGRDVDHLERIGGWLERFLPRFGSAGRSHA